MADRGNKSACGSNDRQNPIGSDLEKVRWLSVEQIRKQQRMRRETVVAAMQSGQLPYEQRGSHSIRSRPGRRGLGAIPTDPESAVEDDLAPGSSRAQLALAFRHLPRGIRRVKRHSGAYAPDPAPFDFPLSLALEFRGYSPSAMISVMLSRNKQQDGPVAQLVRAGDFGAVSLNGCSSHGSLRLGCLGFHV